MNLVLLAPHGGWIEPEGWPDRRHGCLKSETTDKCYYDQARNLTTFLLVTFATQTIFFRSQTPPARLTRKNAAQSPRRTETHRHESRHLGDINYAAQRLNSLLRRSLASWRTR